MKAFTATGLLAVFLLGGMTTPLISDQQIIDVPLRPLPDRVEYVPDEFIVVLAEKAGTPAPTNYRMSGMRHMNSYLMSSSGFYYY